MAVIFIYLVFLLSHVAAGILLRLPSRIMREYRDATSGEMKLELIHKCMLPIDNDFTKGEFQEIIKHSSPWAIPYKSENQNVPFVKDLIKVDSIGQIILKNPTGNGKYDKMIATEICSAIQVGIQVTEAINGGPGSTILIDKNQRHVLGVCFIPMNLFSYTMKFNKFIVSANKHNLITYSHVPDNLPSSPRESLDRQCADAFQDCLGFKGFFQFSNGCHRKPGELTLSRFETTV